MPFFIFISGYFSKNLENNEKKSFKNLLFVYLIFQILYGVWEKILHNNNYYLSNIFNPAPALWYILALFLWKKCLKDILSIKNSILVIVFLYIISSFIPFLNTTVFAIGRFIGFMPFFAMGYYTDIKHINFIKNKISKSLAIGVIVFFILFSLLILNYGGISCQNIIDLLCHRLIISKIFDNIVIGIIFEILLIPIAVFISISFIRIINENNLLTYIGRDTLPIFLCHPYIQDIARIVQRKIIVVSNDYINLFISIIFIIITLLLLSNKYFRNMFNKILSNIKKWVFKENIK